MLSKGFDNDKYIAMQSAHIKERIEQFGGKLYLEFGGKLFDDYHASRVLPGFAPDSKVNMLLSLRDQAEIVIAVSASDIESNKQRGDLGITYDMEVFRLIEAFRGIGLFVGSVAITQYRGQTAADSLRKRLEAISVPVYIHYPIPGYPSDIETIISDEGFGKNDYIETSRELVVITAPGPGSGKMATCLSQLYHEHKRGIKAGYSKFETFPIWNLSLKHPVNIAYEAATADLNDLNMIDPFHLQAYGEVTVNYNRDVEIFPVLQGIFNKIYGECPYKSPTDMGVNMVGNCIIDDDVVCHASKMEIIRRYYAALCAERQGYGNGETASKIKLLMSQVGTSPDERPVIAAALDAFEETGEPAASLQLPDGRIIIGKNKTLLGASSALLLNALKALGGIPDEVKLISETVLQPMTELKVGYLGNHNPRLHTDEVLLALSICAVTDENAKRAIEQLSQLKGCDAHSTVILSSVDDLVLKNLGINITCEPIYQKHKIFQK
ncbi:MAG: DUF1846 domain-containing protein [Clostridia bacterium]|nr:DUF1846 domain-containing protein [Oscillospiraceae bacterium]MBQ6797411.1 DUF1846 domain-containing protein [Clostridia bacterium]